MKEQKNTIYYFAETYHMLQPSIILLNFSLFGEKIPFHKHSALIGMFLISGSHDIILLIN